MHDCRMPLDCLAICLQGKISGMHCAKLLTAAVSAASVWTIIGVALGLVCIVIFITVRQA